MTSFFNPLAPKPLGLPGKSTQIKDWVRARLELDDDVIVSVNQIVCREPGCPDIETVIGILRANETPKIIKMPCPIGEVSEENVAQALMEHRPHKHE